MKKAKVIWMCFLTGMMAMGCATEEKLQGTAMAPAAKGTVTADRGSGGNTDLEVEVKHLAQPEKVSAGATDYVVWIQPEGAQSFQNVGVLEIDDDLEGEYETTIPYEKFRVVVTPEPARTGTRPTGPIVLDQYVSR